MKFGVREICDVVFRAKGVTKVGNRIFYRDEPIMYFDTLKTSSLEAASSSVYAQGGRGNPRLVAWDGDRTLTFNMEDALISAEGLQILSGAGLLEASTNDPIRVHTTTRLSGSEVSVVTSQGVTTVKLVLPELPYWASNGVGVDAIVDGQTIGAPGLQQGVTWNSSLSKYELSYTIQDGSADAKKIQYFYKENYIYVMVCDEYGEVYTEPFIPDISKGIVPVKWNKEDERYDPVSNVNEIEGYQIELYSDDDLLETKVDGNGKKTTNTDAKDHRVIPNIPVPDGGISPVFGDPVRGIFKAGGRTTVIVDYYVEKILNAQQIEITADKFGGTYYIEGSTLFRTQQGIDMPAEFVIPNGKIQSNFTFSMAATGDPSTFTFTVDAMPDYTRFDTTKKVLAAIQIIEDGAVTDADRERTYTFAKGIDTANL